MNLIQIDGYKLDSKLQNAILRFWAKEKKKYWESKELVYEAEVDDDCIGLSSKVYEDTIGHAGRSDWYDIEDQDLLERIYTACPTEKENILGVGMLELNGDRFAAHVDPTEDRTHCLNYLLNPGGPDVATVWYDIKPEHAYRYHECAPIPNDRLEEKERHVLQADTWYQLNTVVPHSVENMETTRLSLSIAIKQSIR